MECSETIENNNVIEDLTDSEGEIIGIQYNGGYPDYSYGEHFLPVINISIWRDGKKIMLENNIKLNVYNYNLNTKEEIYLRYIEANTLESYFSFNPDGYTTDTVFKFKLLAPDEEGVETEYELKKSVVKFNSYGTLESIELDLETEDPEAGGGNDEGIVAVLNNILNTIVNFITEFGKSVINGIIEAIKMLFVPPDNMMDVIQSQIYDMTMENVSLLNLPLELFDMIINDKAEYWVGENCGMTWQEIQWKGATIFPGGSINFVDMINQNEGFKQLHNYYYLLTDGVMAIWFANYLKSKYEQIFK